MKPNGRLNQGFCQMKSSEDNLLAETTMLITDDVKSLQEFIISMIVSSIIANSLPTLLKQSEILSFWFVGLSRCLSNG